MNRHTILGIVAEYDPFHNGHLYHLNKARKAVRPDAVYAVLSPVLKQRGELAMLPPHIRAACALHEGVDAVFSLPVLWTVRDAEHYALGAVSMLAGLGVTHIAFGAETADPAVLQSIADLLEDPPESMTRSLHTRLSEGLGYPAALCCAASDIVPGAERILQSPNNILAVCYLRALRRLRSGIVPVIIPRSGGYHDANVSAVSPSASSLRAALSRGVYTPVFSAVPAYCASMIRRCFLDRQIPDLRIWNTLVADCLRTEDLSALPDLSEGLEHALKKAAVSFRGENIADRLASRRYPAARISRLCALAVLGVTQSRLDSLTLPGSALLLAIRKTVVPTDQWKDLPVRIYGSAAEWKSAADPEDIRSWSLRSACCSQPDTLPFTEKVYTE